ncbi:MAG: C48 family peptidase, partial [Wolbachia endosymbiont of Alcedoecus sp.]|nr:C48 family peptidase [Wolbachia endosymbiont of Alcedoecus sp.]
KQQNDGCNCGVFALENASKITQMLSEGKSFDEIDKELSEYKFDLNKKRKEFAEALMNDEKWKEDLETGLLCDLSPRTATSLTSEVKNVWPYQNI